MLIFAGDRRRILGSVLKIYAFAFPIASLMALFFCSQDIMLNRFQHDRTPVWAVMMAWFIGLYHTALATPLILYLGERFPFDKSNWVGRCFLHFIAASLFASLSLASEAWIFVSFHVFQGLDNFSMAIQIQFINGFHPLVLTYAAIFCVQLLNRYYHQFQDKLATSIRLEAQALELKIQLGAARIKSLNLQIQPRFLFSTLNAISKLVRDSRLEQSEEMLGGLSDLLRWVLVDGDAQEVTLDRELKYVRLYLEIERIRLQDRLRVSIDVDSALLSAAVPYMVLQPLVEGALHHDVDPVAGPVSLQVSAALREERLELSIRNEYCPVNPDSTVPCTEFEISRQRLESLYGAEAQISISYPSDGVRVGTVILPYRELDGDKQMPQDLPRAQRAGS